MTIPSRVKSIPTEHLLQRIAELEAEVEALRRPGITHLTPTAHIYLKTAVDCSPAWFTPATLHRTAVDVGPCNVKGPSANALHALLALGFLERVGQLYHATPSGTGHIYPEERSVA